MTFPLFPDQASTVARQVDALFFALIALCGSVLLLILVAMVAFLFKYRRAKPADRSPRRLPTTAIEVSWTVIPTLLFMGVFAWGAVVYFDIQHVPEGTIHINVVGKQWMWKIQHPNGVREIDELHVPVGRVVKLTMASQDVIHSFFIPAFRIKQDVVPGRYSSEWFVATKPGKYHIFCAEYCGKDHSGMIGSVVVMKPEDYEQWLVNGAPSATLAQSGEKLFRELGCSGCHVGTGVVRAPPLEGIFGRPTPLQNGQVVIADEGYIRDSILLPQKHVAAGYEPLMPTFQGRINEEELLELMAYIKSMGAKQSEGRP